MIQTTSTATVLTSSANVSGTVGLMSGSNASSTCIIEGPIPGLGPYPQLTTLAALALLAAVLALAARRSRRVGDWFRRNQFRLLTGMILTFFLILYLAPDIFVTIPVGSAGVLWRRFAGGTVLGRQYGEGTHIIAPWNEMFIYNLKYQRADLSLQAITKEGLAVQVGLTIHYNPISCKVPRLHQAVGPDYLNALLVPEMQAAVRAVAASITMQDVYEITTGAIEDAVNQQPQMPLQSEVISIQDILVTGVVLPIQVQQAIQEKLQEQQKIGEMEYRLYVERLEAQRKTIEARGIENFQSIVAQGISPRFLQWKGIDATLELARSNNAKVVVIGSSKDGLPIILGGLEGAGGPPPPPGPLAVPNAPRSTEKPLHSFDTRVPATIAPPPPPDLAPPLRGTTSPHASEPGSPPPAGPPGPVSPPPPG